MKQFSLAFDPASIPGLAARYHYEDDVGALEAGKRIRSGQYTRENLNVIFEWKTGGRGRSRLARNTDAEIADVLELATRAKTDRAAVAVLMGLNA